MDERIQQSLSNLEAVLQQQIARHEELLTLFERKREALRGGDAKAMPQFCALENEKVQAISELEKQRARLAADLTLALEPTATAPLKLGELAERLPEPMRGKLLVRRQQLVERMEKVREAGSVLRRATESLVKHVHGLVQTIGTLSTGVSTYSRQGGRPSEAMALRTINLTA